MCCGRFLFFLYFFVICFLFETHFKPLLDLEKNTCQTVQKSFVRKDLFCPKSQKFKKNLKNHAHTPTHTRIFFLSSLSLPKVLDLNCISRKKTCPTQHKRGDLFVSRTAIVLGFDFDGSKFTMCEIKFGSTSYLFTFWQWLQSCGLRQKVTTTHTHYFVTKWTSFPNSL